MKKKIQIIFCLISILVMFSCKQINNKSHKKTIKKKTIETDLCLIWHDEIYSNDYLSINLSNNLSKVDYFNENGMFLSTEDNGQLNYEYSGDTIFLNFKINYSYEIFVDMFIFQDIDNMYNYTIITNKGLNYMPHTGKFEPCQ